MAIRARKHPTKGRKKKEYLKVGDRIAFTAEFVKTAGEGRKDVADRRGTVISTLLRDGYLALGPGNGSPHVLVQWDDRKIQKLVAESNICKVGSIAFSEPEYIGKTESGGKVTIGSRERATITEEESKVESRGFFVHHPVGKGKKATPARRKKACKDPNEEPGRRVTWSIGGYDLVRTVFDWTDKVDFAITLKDANDIAVAELVFDYPEDASRAFSAITAGKAYLRVL